MATDVLFINPGNAHAIYQDLESIFKITEIRRMHNVDNFFAGKFGTHYINNINSLSR
jgi:hypothetical protein